MLYTGALLYAEIYDTMAGPYTDVRAVWEARRGRHPGRCVVANAHWWDPGPRQCGNYKADGVVLSRQYAEPFRGFGWNAGEPRWTQSMDNYNNFVSTVVALVGGERQALPNIPAITGRAARTWLGRSEDGDWTLEVSTTAYTGAELVEHMEALGIIDAMIFDGGGSSQAYDGHTQLRGDGRRIYSYLLCWFAEEEGEKEDAEMYWTRGIDVAEWQGEIDWEAVKAAGVVDFAMLKAGSGQSRTDPMFKRNADECTRLGIPFGVYFFSYAYTPELARKEARRCLELIAPYKLSYPVAWDYEYDSYDNSVELGVTPTRALVSDMARAFLGEVEAAGYYAMLYANPDYIQRFFDDALVARYDIWLAQWQGNGKKPEDKPALAGGMWQYSNQGNNGVAVPGVPTRVDLNYAYYDYPALICQPAEPEPEPEPEKPEEEDKPMTWEEEQQAATAWVKAQGLSDGERPDDGVKRVELWVTLWRMFKLIKKLIKEGQK